MAILEKNSGGEQIKGRLKELKIIDMESGMINRALVI